MPSLKSSVLVKEELKEVLEIVLKQMEQEGILKNVTDRENLIENTLTHITNNNIEISRDQLNTPAMKTKLGLALVATFTQQHDDKFEFNFDLLFKNDPSKEEKKTLQKQICGLIMSFNKVPHQGGEKLMQLLNQIGNQIEDKFKQKNKDDPGFIFAGIYDDAGNLINILEGVAVSKGDLAKAVISISELLATDLQPELQGLELKGFAQNTDLSRQASSAPKMIPGGLA